jgi:hypothetical protein
MASNIAGIQYHNSGIYNVCSERIGTDRSAKTKSLGALDKERENTDSQN